MATKTEENLSTLRIHKLTQAQYNKALQNNEIEDKAIYLTTEEYSTPQFTIVVSNTKPTVNDTSIITLVRRGS